jgi:hypothetical protein
MSADEKKIPTRQMVKNAAVVWRILERERKPCTLPERLTPRTGRAGKSNIAWRRTHGFKLAESPLARKPGAYVVFVPRAILNYTSRFDTFNAFFSMNSRRGSTASPISVVNISSAATASSMRTCRTRRVSGLMVVSQS